MLARREALESAGWLDERLFLYCDDPDLGLRIKQAGWSVRHLPQMAILHHARKMGWNPRGHAQYAYAYRQYFAKHLSRPHRARGSDVAALGYALRALAFPFARRPEPDAPRAMHAALRTLVGRDGPPYEPPPPTAVRPRAIAGAALTAPVSASGARARKNRRGPTVDLAVLELPRQEPSNT